MDPPYRTSVVSDSAAFTGLLLSPASDSIITNARGSSGVDPWVVTMSASSMGDWLNGERKRLVLSRSLMFSTFAMLCFTALAVRGGGTDLSLMRPKIGSPWPGATGAFEETAPSLT